MKNYILFTIIVLSLFGIVSCGNQSSKKVPVRNEISKSGYVNPNVTMIKDSAVIGNKMKPLSKIKPKNTKKVINLGTGTISEEQKALVVKSLANEHSLIVSKYITYLTLSNTAKANYDCEQLKTKTIDGKPMVTIQYTNCSKDKERLNK